MDKEFLLFHLIKLKLENNKKDFLYKYLKQKLEFHNKENKYSSGKFHYNATCFYKKVISVFEETGIEDYSSFYKRVYEIVRKKFLKALTDSEKSCLLYSKLFFCGSKFDDECLEYLELAGMLNKLFKPFKLTSKETFLLRFLGSKTAYYLSVYNEPSNRWWGLNSEALNAKNAVSAIEALYYEFYYIVVLNTNKDKGVKDFQKFLKTKLKALKGVELKEIEFRILCESFYTELLKKFDSVYGL